MKVRLKSAEAFARAEQIRSDYAAGKYPTVAALARAYDVAHPYVDKILKGTKCFRAALPKANWKPITLHGIEFYVSDCGMVWSVSRNMLMELSHRKSGYRIFGVVGSDGIRHNQKVHRLVLTLFKRKPRPGEVGRHLDDDRANNHISNLAWGSFQDNADDAKRNGKTAIGEDVFASVLTEKQVLTLINSYKEGTPLETHAIAFKRKYKVSVCDRQLVLILRGKYWKHLLPEGFSGYDAVWEKKLDEKAVRNLHKNFIRHGHEYSSKEKFYVAFAEFLNSICYNNVSPRTLKKAHSGNSWREIYSEFY